MNKNVRVVLGGVSAFLVFSSGRNLLEYAFDHEAMSSNPTRFAFTFAAYVVAIIAGMIGTYTFLGKASSNTSRSTQKTYEDDR